MPHLPYIKHSDKEELAEVEVSQLLHEHSEGFGFFIYTGGTSHTAFIYPAGESRVRFITRNEHTKEQVSVIVDNTVSFGELEDEAQEIADRWEEDAEG